VLQHSLTWITASSDGVLVGFVNVATDGGAHAFLLDTTVHPDLAAMIFPRFDGAVVTCRRLAQV
jgi:hypothetical protein